MNASIDFISTNIGDIADVISGPFGSQLHESDYKEHGTPIVTVEHLSPYGLTTQNLPFVGDEDKERLNRYTLKQGDIVFSRVGSVDRCSLVREKEEGWLFSGRLLRIRLNNSDKEMATLLSYIFQTNRFTHQVRSKAVGQTMPSLNNGIVKSLQISIPRNPRLQKIYCDTLINVDQKINLLTKKKEALETYKKGLMQKIFSQELRFKREDGTDYPEWERCSLGDVGDLQNGFAFKSDSYVEKGDYSIVTIKNVQNGKLIKGFNYINELPKNIKKHHRLKMDDLLISMTGNVGRVCLVNQKNLLLNQRVGLIVLTDEMDKRLCFYQLQQKSMLNYFITNGEGAAQPNISKDVILNAQLRFPTDNKEKIKVVNFFSRVDILIDNVQDSLESAVKLKKGLLQQMFV